MSFTKVLVQLAVQNTGSSGKLLSSNFVPCVSRSLSTTLVNCNLAKDKGEAFVHNVFSNVADSYDKMNDLMSGGIHRLWKCYFIKTLDPLKSTHLLDVAGGTGDIAFRFLDHMKCKYPNDKSHKVTVCDINENMLEVGKKRAVKHGYDDSLIEWVHGDAQKLPFPDNSFDAYTISFGIRNVVNIDAALQESYRVLKPGGIFLCLEFSKVRTPVIADLYDLYSLNIIPVMGEVVAGDWRSYQYLVESIRKFPDQKDFADMIRSAGFHLVSYKNLTQGVAAIHMGYKRSEPANNKDQPPVEFGTESTKEHSTS
ncbi:2-methoxy-6-polyprenyl-1,4-benzoquinol methylase, mitochondrial [Tetranychus urticae]|uniref:2-methoxy-6-polyprenyl-1,4-benzoquinol methylase, mitochondrial n=1 Tax=Tetranychus urticae TaxID=32264 RepID=T1KJR2_TETUR|nr:2-methoxy-6-polyprenyl-1,4-benzoquinol methylase, mitochondrial [Tetranychus urticae]